MHVQKLRIYWNQRMLSVARVWCHGGCQIIITRPVIIHIQLFVITFNIEPHDNIHELTFGWMHLHAPAVCPIAMDRTEWQYWWLYFSCHMSSVTESDIIVLMWCKSALLIANMCDARSCRCHVVDWLWLNTSWSIATLVLTRGACVNWMSVMYAIIHVRTLQVHTLPVLALYGYLGTIAYCYAWEFQGLMTHVITMVTRHNQAIR